MEAFDSLFWDWDEERLENCEKECQRIMEKCGVTLEKYPEIPDDAKQIATDIMRQSDCPFDELTEIIIYAKFMAILSIYCEKRHMDQNTFDVRVHGPYPMVYYKGVRF